MKLFFFFIRVEVTVLFISSFAARTLEGFYDSCYQMDLCYHDLNIYVMFSVGTLAVL